MLQMIRTTNRFFTLGTTSLIKLIIACVASLALVLAMSTADAKPRANKKQQSQSHAYKQAGKSKFKALGPRAKASALARGGKQFKNAKGFKGAKMHAKWGSKKFKRVKYYVPPPPSVGLLSGLHNTPDL